MRTASPRLPVLMYHSISPAPAGPLRALAVPPSRLREQLAALRWAGYQLAGLSDALARISEDPSVPVVALTFDDGFVDFLTEAVPILAEADATATLYMAVGHVGGPATWLGRRAEEFGPLLSWWQLREVAAAGVEIGNHSRWHHPLDVLPQAELAEQVWTSRERLRQETQTEVATFAYPHGYHNHRVRAVVAEHGHRTACTVGHRRYSLDGNRLAIPRLQPTGDHSGADLVELVRTGGPVVVPSLKRLAQPGWRLTRRAATRLGITLT